MDNFVNVRSKEDVKCQLHLAIYIIQDSVHQYAKGTFRKNNEMLFCDVCNVVLDHNRKSVLERHLKY